MARLGLRHCLALTAALALAGCSSGPVTAPISAPARRHHFARPLVGNVMSWRIRPAARADVQGYGGQGGVLVRSLPRQPGLHQPTAVTPAHPNAAAVYAGSKANG